MLVDRHHINCLQNKSFMFKCGKVSDSMPDFLFSNQRLFKSKEKASAAKTVSGHCLSLLARIVEQERKY